MPQPVKLSDALLGAARAEAPVAHRSIPGQIEHWASLGRSVELALTQGQIARLKAGLPLDSADAVAAGTVDHAAPPAPVPVPVPVPHVILRELRPRGRNGGRRRSVPPAAAPEPTTAAAPPPEPPPPESPSPASPPPPESPSPARPPAVTATPMAAQAIQQTGSLEAAFRVAVSPEFAQLALALGSSGQQPWIGRHAQWPGALCQLATDGRWLPGRWFAGAYELAQDGTA